MENKLPVPLSANQITDHINSPVPAEMPDNTITNWSGNIIFNTKEISFPQTVAEVQELVQKHKQLKALGSRHCFNRIADSHHYLLSLKELNKVVILDREARTVTVEAGIKYGELAPYLHDNGFALPNLASLPHISVAGSIITATHGSGVSNGNLATTVIALEIVTAEGNIQHFSKEQDEDTFNGLVVNLGAIGIITKVTLAVEPTFKVQQNVYEKLPLMQLKDNFEAIVAAGYSVSLFTDWLTDNINQVWIKSRTENLSLYNFEPEFYGATAATQNRHPILEMPAENCTEQMGVPGPWHERLPHFKMGFTPSSGVELQSEYFIPRQHAVEAILAIARLGKQINSHLLISEIRTIAADNLWLSPCYKQSCVALHFTWKQDWPAVSKLLPIIEKELAPFNVRPHWGKLYSMAPDVLASRYEKLPVFKNLVSQFDPKGKFRNEFLNTTIYGGLMA